MKTKISFEYNIGDRVDIDELKRPGRVSALFVSDSGIQYRVRYFWQGNAKDEYFYSDEISPQKTVSPGLKPRSAGQKKAPFLA